MRASLFVSGLGAVVSGLFVLTLSPPARAITIAADAEVAVPVSTSGYSAGVGFAGRLGHQFRLPALTFTPELGVSYHALPGDVESLTAVRGFGGARLGIGEVLRPTIYGHIGYGHASFSGRLPSFNGLTYDLGAALDFTLLPFLDIGLHVAYTTLVDSDVADASAHWVAFGAHAALSF